ncbi:putative holin-like toxin [Eubacterium sp. An3]|nr:putative holin-like toxin [Eubacterium sp. An3]
MKNHFDFNDLIQFGMFIISLLTYIYVICQH